MSDRKADAKQERSRLVGAITSSWETPENLAKKRLKPSTIGNTLGPKYFFYIVINGRPTRASLNLVYKGPGLSSIEA